MREIEFRGKDIEDGDWVYGYLDATMYKTLYCIHTDYGTHTVIPETIGQYTGLRDKNGEMIFEGDIVSDKTTEHCYEILWSEECAGFIMYRTEYIFYRFYKNDTDFISVVGNIHDNKELLKGGEE